MIDTYKEPLDILTQINLCNSSEAKQKSPNKLAFAKAGRQELATLCGIIKKFMPKKIVEVGVAAGGTSSVIMSAVNKMQYHAELYCLDWAEYCFWDKTKEIGFVSQIANRYMEDYCNLHLLTGRTLIQEIEAIGNDIDLLLLDTSHVLPGEILDYLVAFPYLKEHAIVIVDDILTPIIHQLPPYNNPNAYKQIAPRLLWSSIDGEEINVLDKNWEKYQYGIKQVDKTNMCQIKRMLDLLCLPWEIHFNKEILETIEKHMKRYYDETIVREFLNVVELNHRLLESGKM